MSDMLIGFPDLGELYFSNEYNELLDFSNNRFGHLLQTLNQRWLTPHYFRTFADSIHARVAALHCVWGFVDGILKGCCRPGQHQRKIYNWHKRYHGLKYLSVPTISGIIAYLFKGSRHNSVMLAFSGLLQKLQLITVLETSSIMWNNKIICNKSDRLTH